MLALRDVRDQKMHFIVRRNDLEFARQNRDFFVNLAPAEAIDAEIENNTKLINAAMDYAAKLSNGEISPPKFFDPANIQPPLVWGQPVVLVRTPDAIGPIYRVPSFIGVNGAALEQARQMLSKKSVVDCFDDHFPVSRDAAIFLSMITWHQASLVGLNPSPAVKVVAQSPAAGQLLGQDGRLVIQMA
jgi:hypothetical protein